jgi:hypothetical protein
VTVSANFKPGCVSNDRLIPERERIAREETGRADTIPITADGNRSLAGDGEANGRSGRHAGHGNANRGLHRRPRQAQRRVGREGGEAAGVGECLRRVQEVPGSETAGRSSGRAVEDVDGDLRRGENRDPDENRDAAGAPGPLPTRNPTNLSRPCSSSRTRPPPR